MKKITIFILLLLPFLTLLSNAQKTQAAQFSESIIRLDRSTPNTAISGTVCVKPSSAGAGTEGRVSIEFPSDFTINSNVSNWNTNTSNLPENSTAWPGISANAIFVNGKTVTFSGNDLNSGSTLYCFNFNSSVSSTGSLGNKTGLISTKNVSNSQIDSSPFAFSIVTNDQINVSATVPADPNDFTHSISKITPGSHYSPNTVIEYQISYGSLLSYPTTLIIEASWSLGTLDGDSVPSVEVVNYVPGSATQAYNSTPAVVDSENRTITWTINSFPGNLSDQTVNFKLKTISNSDLGINIRTSFNASGRLLPPGTSTSYDNLMSYFTPGQLGTPPSTGGSSSTTGTTSSPSSTGTQTISQDQLNIEKISMNTISSNQASIIVDTNNFSDIQIYYGTHLNSLNQSVTSKNSTSHLVKLSKLSEKTKYYFKVYAWDSSKKQITSDIYTFTTAKASTPLRADPITLVATSGNMIISESGKNNLVIPLDSVFQFKFSLENRASANSVQAIVRNSKVLGIFSYPEKVVASTESVNLLETQKGVYSGNLKTQSNPGDYELYVRISDQNGNITEQRLAVIKVIDKFTVLSSKNKKPVEGARILLYVFNPSTRTYGKIPSSIIDVGNPLFTNSKGQLDLVLPQGKYKAEVSGFLFKDKSVEFEISPSDNQGFPTVEIEKTEFSLINLFNYYTRTLSDVFLYSTQTYSENLTGSSRFFDLVALISMSGLVVLTLFAFSKRHHIPITSFPSYFYYLLDRKSRNEKYIHGVIYDDKENPIPSANVYLTDKLDEKIISHTKTNKHGEFFFRKGKSKYLIMAMAKNYKTSPIFEYHEREHLKFKINLEKQDQGIHPVGRAIHVITHLVGISFGALLLGSFIFELLFLNSFGVLKTLPFLCISIFNLALWILHLHKKSHP